MRRATVYRHFPDERSLYLGCSGLSRERNPAPDPALWAAIADPGERLEAALEQIYRWYEEIEPLMSALLRDMDTVPIVAELQAAGRLAYLARVEDGLAVGWGARGRRAKRVRAALGLALDFLAWRTLHERGLGNADAIAVMASAVAAAASR